MDAGDGSIGTGPEFEVPHVTLSVNGVEQSLPASIALISALRAELDLTGTKPGCGEGACGSCTVLVDGEPVKACQQKVAEAAGRSVTTIEALASAGRLHRVQQAFAEIGAAQCGYCTPGMIMSVVALLEHVANPDDGVIDEALEGNICRCGSYPQVRRAVHRAVELTKAGPEMQMLDARAMDRWEIPQPATPHWRPARPWDMTDPQDCEWFVVLGDGLMVVLLAPPLVPGTWTTGGGAWLHVASDGAVTAFTGKVDVGQDNCTALRLLVAEGLRVPLANVRLAMGDTDLCPYDMGTFGSRSMPDAGGALAKAAAHARTFLPVDVGQRRLVVVTGEPEITAPSEWRAAGRAHVPEGMVSAVTGSRRFISDLVMPGLRYGAVLRAPVVGATLRDLDATGLDDFAGVELVRTRKVTGVVAGDPVSARMALASVRAHWDVPDAPSDGDIENFLRTHPVAETGGWGHAVHDERGDPDATLAAAKVRGQATYTTAYIAPAALETRGALAVWDDDGRLTVWVGTQTPFGTRAQVAAELDLAEERVRVIVPPTGGGFGGKHGGGVALEAALMAREVGAPVKVSWSRHEEFTAGTLRPAAVIDVAGAATAEGGLTAWTFTNINSGAAAITMPYAVANQRIEFRPAASPLLQASYRALAATANNFARESQIDELAYELDMDPIEFRLGNLDDERLAAVLTAAAQRFRWRAGSRAGQGIALAIEKGGRAATVAQVAEVEGELEVVRLVTAYECGAIVNPQTVINQIEGATIMALGGALFEAIRFDHGVITNGSFSHYRVPRITDVPPIDVVLLDRPDLPSAGAGETPMICVAPAIANAIFDLTRRRLRSLPLNAEGLVRFRRKISTRP
jgi:isoquinoline 1-oxidoreductase